MTAWKPPETLLQSNLLIVPAMLEAAYRAELQSRSLLTKAVNANSVSVAASIGGASKEEAEDHFAYRFLNSATRLQRLLLDLPTCFAPSSAALLRVLGHGRCAVLDTPSGSGGSIAGLLSTIAVLRQSGAIPTLPVTLTICAGDISPDAIGIYRSMMERIAPQLAAVGITIHWTSQHCDLTNVSHAVTMCDNWITHPFADEYLVLIGNFSGAAKSQIEKIRPAFTHIAERISVRVSTLLWIEPTTKSGQDFFKKIKSFWAHIVNLTPFGSDELQTAHYIWRCPIQQKDVSSAVSLIRFLQTPKER